MELHIHWGNLHRMLAAFDDVGQQSSEIAEYFGQWVCDRSPFTGALSPIGDMLPALDDAMTGARSLFSERWTDVRSAVEHTAREVQGLDGEVGRAFETLGQGFGGRFPADVFHLDVDPFPVQPVDIHLEAPAEGDDRLRHDPTFEAAADTWDAARDTINLGVDTLNAAVSAARGLAEAAGVELSFTIPKLPEQSLRDHLVYPLSADYRGIRRNAAACTQVDDAMEAWGGNFSRLALKVPLALEGRTSVALMAQLNAYNLVMRTVGEGIAQGRQAFEWVAEVSERIAVAVEHAIVELSERLSRLVAKIASRFSPVVGWASLVYEFARKGIDAVADIIHDVQEIVALIETCRALVDEVRAFAQVAADRIGALREVPSLMRALPGVGAGGTGSLTAPGLPVSTSPEESALDAELDALEAIG